MVTKIAKYAIGGAIIVGTITSVPALLGFGTAGIVKSSLAAGWQSGIGNVAANSGFAFFQSLGAKMTAGKVATAVIGGAAGGAVKAVKK